VRRVRALSLLMALLASSAAAASVDGYKREAAARIAQASPESIADTLPEMLKSIVVLNVAIDRKGNLTHLSVRRSNGHTELEKRAMDSVRRGAPFSPPGALIRRGQPSLRYLETFLFREDGRFQIRSLVL
jgi:periplasmic protein TonB